MTSTHSTILTRILTGASALVLTTGIALGPHVANADTLNPQQTVSGCTLQGGCMAAADANPTEQGAVNWAAAQIGQAAYYEECLSFVHDAYLNGGGVDIGAAPTAVDYWNANPTLQHAGDTNPPTGALVFWEATSTNSAGHVGIAEGGDTVISSYEEATTTIHEFSIAARNAAGYPYLGWILPA